MTDRDEAIDLLPCPFCGGDNLEWGGNFVACRRCRGSSYTEEGDEEEARTLWNSRTAYLAKKGDELVARLRSGHRGDYGATGRLRAALIDGNKERAEAADTITALQAERDQLMSRVMQSEYPCSPVCDGYLREREEHRRAEAAEARCRELEEALGWADAAMQDMTNNPASFDGNLWVMARMMVEEARGGPRDATPA